MKILPIILVIGALAGTGMSFVLRGGDSGRPSSREPRMAISLSEHVAANGLVEGARPEIALRPEVQGTITVIPFRENGQVKKGELLIELQNETQKQQAALALAELGTAKANLDRLINGERPERRKAVALLEKAKKAIFDLAQADHERTKRLTSNATSKEQQDADFYKMLRAQAEYESAKADRELVEAPAQLDEVNAAKSRVEAGEAKLHLAESELAKTRILAPCDGSVLQVYSEPGELAGPSSVQPVLILADLSKRRVRAFIEELDASRVRTGQKAIITSDSLGNQELTGHVAIVVPRMGKRSLQSDSPGEYKDLYFREVLIDLEHGDELPPNLRVRALIEAK